MTSANLVSLREGSLQGGPLFEFPRDALKQYFTDLFAKAPHIRERAAEKKSLSLLEAEPPLSEILWKDAWPLKFAVAALIEHAEGRVYCPACAQWFATSALACKIETSANTGALTGGHGRGFYCPSGHLVHMVWDLRA